MLYLMEGQEGTGKTTIGRALAQEFRATYIRPGDMGMHLIHNDWKDQLIQAYMLRQLARDRQPVVFDRSIISSAAYTPYLNLAGFKAMFSQFLCALAPTYDTDDIVLVHLIAPGHVRQQRDPAHHTNPALDEYAAAAAEMLPRAYQFNTSELTPGQILAHLRGAAVGRA